MYSKLLTCILYGLEGKLVEVEGHLASGLPAFSIVGLPDAAIKESKERVRSAIQNSGFRFPVSRITINLSPANLRKEGSQLDLPIALSILCAAGIIEPPSDENIAFLGELALSGEILPVPGALPMVLGLEEMGIRHIVLPKANLEECYGLKETNLYPAETLLEVIKHFKEEERIEPVLPNRHYFMQGITYDLDFSDIKGQQQLKRAMEIAAAGHHNLLIVGPPGSGKTMAARRMPTILPPLSFDESVESTKIYSISNLLRHNRLMSQRPFRSPHHTSSAVALIGGGSVPKPGEVSLAHNGVLFLDEFPEFQKNVIEALRQPMEDGIVTISRANARFTFPSDFLLLASMNPCPCGYFGDENHDCTCSVSEIRRYLGRISNPILDRIDLHTEVKAVPYQDLQKQEKGESSDKIRERVENARNIQTKRYGKTSIRYNSQLTSKLIQEYVKLDTSMNELLQMAFDTYHFSARSLHKILKVARTIADLADEKEVKTEHLLEAIRFRGLDKKYWMN